jgi:hypothetical protein
VGGFANRLSTRSRMCIVWVLLFMVVCSVLLFWSSDVLILYAMDLHLGNIVVVDETIRKKSADVLSSLWIPHPRCNAHYLPSSRGSDNRILG